MLVEHASEINICYHQISKSHIQSYRYDYQQMGGEFQPVNKCHQGSEDILGKVASSKR